jgi:5-methyltetrahydrofolate--homocysteine methyltransferase
MNLFSHPRRVVLMDGAMGTELQRAGLPDGEPPETWNLTRPQHVRAVHHAYAAAGADVLLTNTFQAHRRADLWAAAVEHARAEAAGRPVLASVGPTDEPLTDLVARLDGVLFETWSSADAARAMAGAGPRALLSVTYHHTPAGIVARNGEPPEWFAERAAGWGAVALGVNCGRDMTVSDCAAVVRRYRTATDLPLVARPNAGTPTRTATGWVYPETPESMAARLPELLEAGAVMVGGCCGTTPAHIAAFRRVVDAWNARD